eukprot:SAG11_NODE_1809_length_4224_cov_5.960000_3_plen_248_part_00
MDNPAPTVNAAAAASGGSAEIRRHAEDPVGAEPPSPGTILVGEQAQLTRLKDDMTRILGSRLNRRQGLQREHYERFQRALCGVSTDAGFGSIGAARRGPWSDDIRSEVVAQINRLQHSTGFRHFKTPNLPISAFESIFGDNTLEQHIQSAVAPPTGPAFGEARQSTESGDELRKVKESFDQIDKQIVGLEERSAKQFAQAQSRHGDLLKLLREQQAMLAEMHGHPDAWTPRSTRTKSSSMGFIATSL